MCDTFHPLRLTTLRARPRRRHATRTPGTRPHSRARTRTRSRPASPRTSERGRAGDRDHARRAGPTCSSCRTCPSPTAGDGQVRVARRGDRRQLPRRLRARGPATGRALPAVAGAEGAGTVRRGRARASTEVAAGDRVAWSSVRRGATPSRSSLDAALAVPRPGRRVVRARGRGAAAGHDGALPRADTYPVRRGDTVVVHAAAGGVGLLLTQLVKLRGGHGRRDRLDRRRSGSERARAGADHAAPATRASRTVSAS